MKIFRLIAVICVMIMAKTAIGQSPAVVPKFPPLGKNDTIKVALNTIDGEFIPWVPLREVVIWDYRIFKTPEERTKYNRLRYNVMKAMPYALRARARYEQLQRELAVTGDKKAQKLLVKAFDKDIKNLFNTEVKNLTITQGEILIKLIDREMGATSYDLLKTMKGGFTAFFYQSAARVFGHNLKQTYDPTEEHDIESILNESSYNRYNVTR